MILSCIAFILSAASSRLSPAPFGDFAGEPFAASAASAAFSAGASASIFFSLQPASNNFQPPPQPCELGEQEQGGETGGGSYASCQSFILSSPSGSCVCAARMNLRPSSPSGALTTASMLTSIRKQWS